MKRGVWNNLLIGTIIMVILLGVIIFFWAKQSSGVMDFLEGLFGLAP